MDRQRASLFCSCTVSPTIRAPMTKSFPRLRLQDAARYTGVPNTLIGTPPRRPQVATARHTEVIPPTLPPRPYNAHRLALTPGTRLGVYEVTAQIGEGGMGQVYRARDTKLNREVALKILPDAFASDPDRLARFTREAQTLASLNHPNIAHIHGLEESGGVRALVIELVEGEDLSQRIARGAIPARRGAAAREACRQGARNRARAEHLHAVGEEAAA